MAEAPERNLAMDIVRITEAAALASARWVGRGNKEAGDGAAVEAMRNSFSTIHIDGVVVIGEGEKDKAPMLYSGEKVGIGDGPKLDVAVDPVEGTNLLAYGRPNAISVVGIAPRGSMFNLAQSFYMQKLVVGARAKGVVDLDAPVHVNLERVAKALGKKYYRFSVGGMKDEAEIKGHRRTYVGALPGKIIQGLKIVKTKSPVFLIDEIDKMGVSYNGDPASALLEALDSEQNKEFRDRYLDIPFDVSQVLFIVTANTLETIPEPLLDRMEVIEMSGYTSNEKLNIAKKYLLPKSFEKNGLDKGDVKYPSKSLLSIANQYAREAGVRNLEKSLDKINRKVLLELLENPSLERPVKIDKAAIEKYLGKPIFPEDDIVKADKVGTALGLAWTSMGGDTLLIEAENYPGKGELKVTGQLGDVMKESVSIAWTYIKRTAERRGFDRGWFETNNVHLHVPEGATPKDGPSAGITLTCALYSLLTDQVMQARLAMTGELTLTGKVMPIGGLREKVLAAKRNGVRTIIIPRRNSRDLDELTEDVKEGIDFHLVDEMDEVLAIAFPDDKTRVMSEKEYQARLKEETQKAASSSDDKYAKLVDALKSVLE